MTYAITFKKFAVAAALTIGAIGISSQAQAMTLHNCTDDPLRVTLQDKNGNVGPKHSLASYGSRQIHATNGYGPYRIILPDLGPGAHFSGRHGDGTFSLVRTSGGNIGLRNGKVCQEPVVQPVSNVGTGSGGNGAQVCFKNNFGLEVCIRP